jgi:hypothetical protein
MASTDTLATENSTCPGEAAVFESVADETYAGALDAVHVLAFRKDFR